MAHYNSTLFRPKQGRFQMSYKRNEYPLYMQMENFLMQDLGIETRCDIHKYAIKTLYNLRTKAASNVGLGIDNESS